ncbi:Exosome component 10 [Borealophlyctis nickersoniae]|nr:Exosome component 10 [Borealophlyctis nickersoniae]
MVAMEEDSRDTTDLSPEKFDKYQESLFSALMGTTKASHFLTPADVPFYRTSSREFDTRLQGVADSLLKMSNDLLAHSLGPADKGIRYEDLDDVMDRFDHVVDTVDTLLERADMALDEFAGRIKKNAAVGNIPGQTGAVMLQVPLARQGRRSDFNVVHAQNIMRPQLKFEDKIDNSNRPFIRKIINKPNALRPLDYGLPGSEEMTPEMSQHLKTMGITSEHTSLSSLPHPYEWEIQNIKYPDHLFVQRPEMLYAPMESTPFTWVDTEEKLNEVAALLDGVTEIAVDLEHHDYRSFQGFTCLIQISTRNEDFIIDALALRSHLHVLNSSFTNPNIVKVFHGAEMDIQWLQRDFGVYVVGLFDTYHASHVLELPQHGLAYLMTTYCNVETNKKFQLADWRIRPLPTEMSKYARSDTHYLLYIYDRMRNEILTRCQPGTHNLMQVTLDRSQQTALNKYEKDIYDAETGEGPNGWRRTLGKFGGAFNAEQFAVFKALHAWRDHVAREEDESIRFVLPHHMLTAMADRMPTDGPGVLGCCDPVPPLVRVYSTDLAMLIENARVEARKNLELKQAELEKVKAEMTAKEREWQEKKKRGPVHTRFEDEDMSLDRGNSSTVTLERTSHASSPAVVSSPVTNGEAVRVRLPGSAGTFARIQIAATSGLFGSLGKEDADERASRLKAEEIRHTLYLVAPSPESILKRKRESKPESLSIATPTQRTEPASTSAVSQVTSTPNGSSAQTVVTPSANPDDEWGSDQVKIRQPGKKKSKRSPNDSPAESAQQSPVTTPSKGNFEPFDYSKARSVVGGGAAGAGDDEGESGSSRAGEKRVFSPYSSTDGGPNGSKKAGGGKLRPKAGNKSHSYK